MEAEQGKVKAALGQNITISLKTSGRGQPKDDANYLGGGRFENEAELGECCAFCVFLFGGCNISVSQQCCSTGVRPLFEHLEEESLESEFDLETMKRDVDDNCRGIRKNYADKDVSACVEWIVVCLQAESSSHLL